MCNVYRCNYSNSTCNNYSYIIRRQYRWQWQSDDQWIYRRLNLLLIVRYCVLCNCYRGIRLTYSIYYLWFYFAISVMVRAPLSRNVYCLCYWHNYKCKWQLIGNIVVNNYSLKSILSHVARKHFDQCSNNAATRLTILLIRCII